MKNHSKKSFSEKQKRGSSPKASPRRCEVVRHPGWNPTSTSLEGMASNLSPSQGISTRFNKLSSWIEHTKQNPFYSQTLVSFQATWTAFIKQIAVLRWDCDVKKRCKITLVLHAWQKPRLPGLRTCQPADEEETCWQVRWQRLTWVVFLSLVINKGWKIKVCRWVFTHFRIPHVLGNIKFLFNAAMRCRSFMYLRVVGLIPSLDQVGVPANCPNPPK